MKYPSSCPSHQELNWADFVHGRVDNARDYHHALKSCDCCLELFAASLGNNLTSPAPGFVDRVMAGLPPTGISEHTKRMQLRPWFHYVAAACVTVALVHLGFFDYIRAIPEELQILDHGYRAGYQLQSLLDSFKDLLNFIWLKGV